MFRDQDSLNVNSRIYQGTINWGDGASSPARFNRTSTTYNVGSYWQIAGSHAYAARKTYTVTLTFFDTGNATTFPSSVLTLKVTAV